MPNTTPDSVVRAVTRMPCTSCHAVSSRGLVLAAVTGLMVGSAACSGSRAPVPDDADGVTDEMSETLDVPTDEVSETSEVAEPPDLQSDEVSETPVDVAVDMVESPNDADESGPDSDVAVAPTPFCEPLSGSGSIELPEASGAARFSDGMALVVGDSGHRGRAVWVAPDGSTTAARLPLDAMSRRRGTEVVDDDLEGLSIGADGRLYGLTSAGWLRVWTRDGTDFAQVGTAQPISSNPEFVCGSRGVNCGPNYEGLCLRPAGWEPPSGPSAACVGYAASKARGELVCLVASTGDSPLQADPARILATGFAADHLSDCAFIRREDGSTALLVAGNLYAGSELRLVDEVTGAHASTDIFGAINQEALLDRGDGTWWSLGDLQHYSETSPWVPFRCGLSRTR